MRKNSAVYISSNLPLLASCAMPAPSLRNVPNDEPGMAPHEIWSNESQERYVLAVDAADFERFKAICERERCPFAVLGTATADGRLKVEDPQLGDTPVVEPGLAVHDFQVALRHRHAGIELQGAGERGHRLVGQPALVEQHAEVVVRAGVGRIDATNERPEDREVALGSGERRHERPAYVSLTA